MAESISYHVVSGEVGGLIKITSQPERFVHIARWGLRLRGCCELRQQQRYRAS